MQLSLADRFAGALEFLTQDQYDRKIGVAVSGGGDSMALLHLADDWARAHGISVHAVTVDHGLRDASAAEAAMVAQVCAGLAVSHDVLVWSGWDGTGNLQKAARDARRELIRDWAAGREIDRVLLGHTADDQAETVLMRLARGSGVDGLSGIGREDGIFMRPLLGMGRTEVRDYLRGIGVGWAEDPSNEDVRFDRVKARQMMGHLAELGLTQDRLVQTAAHMGRARDSLNAAMRQLAQEAVTQEAGDLILAPQVYRSMQDHQARLLAAALRWVGGAEYRPRFEALMALAERARAGQAQTLAGCLVMPEAERGIRITREEAAAEGAVEAPDHGVAALWDARWRLMQEGAALTGQVRGAGDPAPRTPAELWIKALGDAGLCQCPDWRETGLPRTTMMASPAVWRGETLISAPLAGYSNGWTARIVTDFHDWLLCH